MEREAVDSFRELERAITDTKTSECHLSGIVETELTEQYSRKLQTRRRSGGNASRFILSAGWASPKTSPDSLSFWPVTNRLG